jgi:hypothetical protein
MILHRYVECGSNAGYRRIDELFMAILKQDNWELVSKILKIIFIIGKHTSHMHIAIYFHRYKIEFNFNAYIKKYVIT